MEEESPKIVSENNYGWRKQFYDLFMETLKYVLKHCGLCWIGFPADGCFTLLFLPSGACCNKSLYLSSSVLFMPLFVMSLFAKKAKAQRTFFVASYLLRNNLFPLGLYGSECGNIASMCDMERRSHDEKSKQNSPKLSSIISEAKRSLLTWKSCKNWIISSRLTTWRWLSLRPGLTSCHLM